MTPFCLSSCADGSSSTWISRTERKKVVIIQEHQTKYASGITPSALSLPLCLPNNRCYPPSPRRNASSMSRSHVRTIHVFIGLLNSGQPLFELPVFREPLCNNMCPSVICEEVVQLVHLHTLTNKSTEVICQSHVVYIRLSSVHIEFYQLRSQHWTAAVHE